MTSQPARPPHRPLDAAQIASDFVSALPGWPSPAVLGTTGSTNADISAAARAGAGEGSVVIADEQSAGRGRLGRTWSSPPGASVSVSLLLLPRPTDPAAISWLPLLAALGVRSAIEAHTGLRPSVKWPNDVVMEEGPRPGKVAGLLVEAVTSAPAAEASGYAVGFGINTGLREPDLPVPEASSLSLSGARPVDRAVLVVECLQRIRRRYEAWVASGFSATRCGLAQEYRDRCSTLGRPVRAQLPGGEMLTGTARDVDGSGRLLVDVGGDIVAVGAGDVVHLRPA